MKALNKVQISIQIQTFDIIFTLLQVWESNVEKTASY